MDYLWIAIAFVFGLLAKQTNLPPMVGYLLAGFVLKAYGVSPHASLYHLGELGVTLLLFAIGLKLRLANLLKPVIWGAASLHMSLIIGLTVINTLFLGSLHFNYFNVLEFKTAALIGLAVSFSSTVCAVKVLEERDEMQARHGQITIGILVLQDLVAVIFLCLTNKTTPSSFAFTLLCLPFLKPLLFRLINFCEHGELLPLAGFFLALSGAALFTSLGLKADLGALVFGVLLSNHSKSTELAKSLLHFKDLFLIGFFLSIGFTAVPTLDMLGVAAIMAICLPVKSTIFFLLLTGFKLRVRSAFLAAFTLANYSEFGLIICASSVKNNLINPDWLVIMALAVTFSFIFTSIINNKVLAIYSRFFDYLKRFERKQRLSEDILNQPVGADILVIGMGRVGTGAYENLKNHPDHHVCGIDLNQTRVSKHRQAGRNVILGDAEDPEFWAQVTLTPITLVMLAIPNHQDIVEVVKQLRLIGFSGKTAGVVRYEDEKKELQAAGIDVAFNLYANAGTGFAEQSLLLL